MKPKPKLHIILFRTPTTTSINDDGYHTSLLDHLPHCTPHHLPILTTSHLNLQHLSTVINNPPKQSIAGVVITSRRAVEAWEKVWKAAQGQGQGWEQVPFFIVGPATRDALINIFEKNRNGGKRLPTFLGAETGTGTLLARVVVDHFQSKGEGKWEEKELLYLTGDKNRETIPDIISSSGVGVVLRKIQVYETCVRDGWEEGFSGVWEQVARDEGNERKQGTAWIALFSPSGARPVLDLLERSMLSSPSAAPATTTEGYRIPLVSLLSLSSSASPTTANATCPERTITIKLAAIGPTTRNYILERGFRLHAMARSPEPDELSRCILEYEEMGLRG
ncbi:tetrapyrrole biosynthesis, uroporphyrinogen III synthase [Meredithblackwellia eburnea MCA 4105]